MKKIFENIHALVFNERRYITAMISADGEQMEMCKTLDPTSKNVEYWMGDVERMMKTTVRENLLKSIREYPQQKRVEWILSHPGQCVLNGS